MDSIPMTMDAHQLLNFGRMVAISRGHDYVNTDHIMISLCTLRFQSFGKMVSEELYSNPFRIAEEIQSRMSDGTRSRDSDGEISYAPHLRRVIQIAYDEAVKNEHLAVGPEHMVLGALIAPEGISRRVMNGFGITADEWREKCERVFWSLEVA